MDYLKKCVNSAKADCPYLWSRADTTSNSSDSADTSSNELPSFIECRSPSMKDSLSFSLSSSGCPTPNRKGSDSDCSESSQLSFQCNKGHRLVLKSIQTENHSKCYKCNISIKLQAVHVVRFHCTECKQDCCSNCVNDEMKVALLLQRSKLMVIYFERSYSLFCDHSSQCFICHY
jgi:hypothetical protein